MKKHLLNWLLVLACVVVLGLGLLNHQQTSGSTENARLIHTIERLSFGIAPGDLQEVKKTGIENYLQAQLNPQTVKNSPALKNYIDKLDTLDRSPTSLFKEYKDYDHRLRQNDLMLTENEKQQLRQQRNQFKRKVIEQARDAHLMRAILSSNQLQEVMVDFWFNHFNVFAQKKIFLFG